MPFDARLLRTLPGDPAIAGPSRQVEGAAWSRVAPTPVAAPRLLGWSAELAVALGLPADPAGLPATWGVPVAADAGEAPDAAARRVAAALLGGNQLAPGMDPYAANYGGHQFGHWAGQLGDGRAIVLGEWVPGAAGGAGEDAGATYACAFPLPTDRHELQLKGAGATPYSRHSDGRAVLRSSLREFACSEAMHALGVPTTRALALVGTGDAVVRDMFYDGHPRAEPGAICTRVAPGFLRLGSFELPAARGDVVMLRALVGHAMSAHYPWLGEPTPANVVRFFAEVARRTVAMVVGWQRVGFVHGVMNTDNLSVLGLTLDYGPYGWLEPMDPDWTPNTTDAHGRRYRYGAQPVVAGWNLSRFAGALLPLVGESTPLREALEAMADALAREVPAMRLAKLGLREAQPGDAAWIDGLDRVLQGLQADVTRFHRALAAYAAGEDADAGPAAITLDAAQRAEAVLPGLGPLRGTCYRDGALAGGDDAHALLAWLASWRARLRAEGRDDAARRAAMHACNPRIVPRNWQAQQAIDAVEAGDDAVLARWLAALRAPYADGEAQAAHDAMRPAWAVDRAGCSQLSCSS